MKKNYTALAALLCFSALLLVLYFTHNPLVTAAKSVAEFDAQKEKSTFYNSKIDNKQVVPILKTVRK